MRVARVEKAGALAVAERTGKAIQLRCKSTLYKFDGKLDAKSMWAVVRQLTSRQPNVASVDGMTAEMLNNHYAAISMDNNYVAPTCKQLTTPTDSMRTAYGSEWHVFRLLYSL